MNNPILTSSSTGCAGTCDWCGRLVSDSDPSPCQQERCGAWAALSRIPAQIRPTVGTLALDADGVLVDYHTGYRTAWHKAFGEWLPDVRRSYHAQERFAARALTVVELAHLRKKGFDEETWFGMPLLPGASEACGLLVAAGNLLEVVSALPPEFGPARLAGLKHQGLDVKAVHAVGGDVPHKGNPKREAVKSIGALVLVDDYAPFLEELSPPTRRVLIESGWENSPNATYVGPRPDEVHDSILSFAKAWTWSSRCYTQG